MGSIHGYRGAMLRRVWRPGTPGRSQFRTGRDGWLAMEKGVARARTGNLTLSKAVSWLRSRPSSRAA